MRTISCDQCRVQRGQSVVEFALFLPLLILLLAGAVDLGNSFQTWINLTNAAREGARYQTSVNDPSGACARAQNALAGTGITVACSAVTISYPAVDDGLGVACSGNQYKTGCPVRVSVQYALNTLVGNVLNFNPITLTGTMDMVVY